MIVLSNAQNVPLTCIEEMIKKEVPFLSNIVLVGDGEEYVCCLVTLKVRQCMHDILILLIFVVSSIN